MSLWKRFGKSSEEPSADTDPRLEYLLNTNSTCACCGQQTTNLLSLAADGPDYLGRDAVKLENSAILMVEGDILTEDFCRIDENRFVRCTIEFPIRQSDQVFLFGCWGSLSQENFERYVSLFDERHTGEMDPTFSWLTNAIPAGAELPVACTMVFQEDEKRPELFIKDEDHPLFDIQANGLAIDPLLDWLASYGHHPFEAHKLN